MLQWHAIRKNQTCPACRGELGNNLIAPGYDNGIKKLYLALDGLEELRALVGTDVFERVGLSERFVCMRTIRELERTRDIADARLAMRRNLTCMQETGGPSGLQEHVLQSKATRIKDAILRHWKTERGISRVNEYRFLERQANVSCYVPVEPIIRVFSNIEDLIHHVNTRERYVPLEPRPRKGFWLPKCLTTLTLKKMLKEGYEQSMSIMTHVDSRNIGCPKYSTEWAFYCPNDDFDNMIFSCPRKVLPSKYCEHILGRSFLGRGGTQYESPGNPTHFNIPGRHCCKYCYRHFALYQHDWVPLEDCGSFVPQDTKDLPHLSSMEWEELQGLVISQLKLPDGSVNDRADRMLREMLTAREDSEYEALLDDGRWETFQHIESSLGSLRLGDIQSCAGLD
jgi:hypothetical protein